MQTSSVVLQTLTPRTAPHQMENVNYLTVETQASWSLRTDSVDPCDTTLLPHHQPVRGPRTRWSPTLQPHTRSLQSGSAALSDSLRLHGLHPARLLSVHGISQARTLECVTISFSRGSSWPRDWTVVSSIGRWALSHCSTWEAPWLLKILCIGMENTCKSMANSCQCMTKTTTIL